MPALGGGAGSEPGLNMISAMSLLGGVISPENALMY